jgi:(heptosyl)LPS beta-1,4-glucosyltransferase
MATLSVIVITHNEAEKIAACLESVKWADEIAVVDSGSTDETCAIARRFTDKVVSHAWSGYAAQKNFGGTLVSSEWILSIDADELVTPELQAEIRAAIQSSDYVAYRLFIRDWMFGKFVNYGSWPQQSHIRLYRSGSATWSGAVHEGVQVQGPVAHLHHPLLHYSHTSIQCFIDKLNTYTEIEAETMFNNGQRSGLLRASLGAVRAFVGQYVRLQGFRDGGHGLILAVLMAVYYFTTCAKLWSRWYIKEHSDRL